MHPQPQVNFSAEGGQVTRVGLGGEGVLRTFGHEEKAREVISRALELGITYFDTAQAYAGSQAYLGSVWAQRPEQREGIFQTSKSASRSRDSAWRELEDSLRTLSSERLQLWQIHDIRSFGDVRALEAEDGALKAFVRAREQGLVQHIGVTGHHDSEVLDYCVRNWPVDSVLLPVNPAETVLGGFLDQVLAAARENNLAVVGMKCLGAGGYLQPSRGLTARKLLRYALDRDVDLVIAGCSSASEVDELAAAARDPQLQEEEERELESLFAPKARRLAFYRG